VLDGGGQVVHLDVQMRRRPPREFLGLRRVERGGGEREARSGGRTRPSAPLPRRAGHGAGVQQREVAVPGRQPQGHDEVVVRPVPGTPGDRRVLADGLAAGSATCPQWCGDGGTSFAAGTDVIHLEEDGRIGSVTVFLDGAPEAP
jgi:hypothetical protein